jgi:hypothetical protein
VPSLRFIADSSPCVCLLGVSSTPLDNASLKAPHHDQQPLSILVTLLAQGSVVVLVVAFGWWGMWKVGSSTLYSRSDSLTAELYPIYVGGCPVADPLEKRSARRGGVGEGRGCFQAGSTHPISSRQPGVRLVGKAHGAERHRADRVPPRTSENYPSRR